MAATATNKSSNRTTGSVTLDDVAKIAGVSPITVSRVLNHPDKVAQKTREKVQHAISLIGYVPNLLAGGLASSKSRLIAALVPSMANSVYAETITFFSNVLREAGYQVLVGESGYSEEQEESMISAVLSRRPDGIFLTGINHSALCRRLLVGANIPVVETWDLTPTPLDVVVGFSHERIAQAVAEYLIAKGHSNIGLISATDHRAQIRERTFIETLAKHGITEVSVSNVPAPTDFKAGRDGLAELLDGGFGKGAVFCSSDTLAQGALAEAQARNLSIPDQLALMGFGDQPYAAYTYPSLSSVRFDRAEIGQRAAAALLSRINAEVSNDSVIDVGFEIVERQSC